jgi:hypothetical protein
MKVWSRKINDRRFQPGRLPVYKVGSDSSAQLVQTSDTAWTLTKIGSVNRAEVVHERYEARRSNPVVLAIG